MKRLLAQIGIAYFTALAASFYFSDSVTFIVMITAAVTAIILFCVRKILTKKFLPYIALAAAFACAVNLAYGCFFVAPSVERYTGDHSISAYISDEPYERYSKRCYPLSVYEVDGEASDFSLLLQTDEEFDCEPFDALCFSSKLKEEDRPYYISKGFYLCAEETHDTLYTVKSTDKKPLYYYAIQLRRAFREAINGELYADEADLCKAVLIGDRYALSEDVSDAFRFSGASYFVVVSGMHFAILISFCTLILRKLLKNRYVYIPVTAVFVIIYMAVTGFAPSVTRSGLMMLFCLFGMMIRRRVYSPNSLAVAGIVMTAIFSPYCAGDIGLILSYAATFAILQWSDPIYEKIKIKNDAESDKKRFCIKALNGVLSLLSVSLAANILVFPISVLVFGAFSSVTLLSALFLYIPVEAVLLLSLAVGALYFLGPLRIVANLFSWPLLYVCRWALFVVRTLSKLPFSYVKVTESFIYVWIALTAILFIVSYFISKGYSLVRFTALCSAMILLCGACVSQLCEDRTLTLHIGGGEDGFSVWLTKGDDLYLINMDLHNYDMYELMSDLNDRYREARFALCGDDSEYDKYERFRSSEFAISKYLLYDSDGGVSPDPNVEIFSSSADIRFDSFALSVEMVDGVTLEYIDCGSVTVLVIPERVDPKLIPDYMKSPDILALGEFVPAYEEISCREAVIAGEKRYALITANDMKASCEEFLFTYEGDVRLRLDAGE